MYQALKILRYSILGYALWLGTFSSQIFSHSSAHSGRSPPQVHARQVATLANGSPAPARRVADALFRFQVPSHCLRVVISFILFHRLFEFSALVGFLVVCFGFVLKNALIFHAF